MGLGAEEIAGAISVCGVLAKALYGPPDRAWLQQFLKSGALARVPFGDGHPRTTEAMAHLRSWAATCATALDERAFEELVSDYNRLFVGPGKLLAPPWESVYVGRERAVFQLETVSVRNWYKRFGLDLASEYNEPADHVGLEFGFVAYLVEQQLHFQMQGDEPQARRIEEAARNFLAQHLLRWVSSWGADAATHARTEFYQGMGKLAAGVGGALGDALEAVPVSRR